MMFVVRMVGRELRASWRRLAFFFVCVAVGVSAIVALRSVIQQVGVAMAGETRALLAADVLVESEQPWSEAARNTLDGILGAEPGLSRTRSIETATMARPADETKVAARVVELRGVQAGFPFYGSFVLQDGLSYHHGLLAGGGALVRPELLTQLDVAVGDDILIGEGRFEIRGVILREPGRQLGAFSFGPRVLIDYDDLLQTGLLTLGTRAERQILLQVPEPRIGPLVASLREPLRDEFVRVRSYRNTEERIARNLSRAEDYLSLIGFVVVVLGGIGVWSVTRVFVQQRVRSVAILKCLGATSRQVLAIYVVEVALLGLGGALLGVALAAGMLAALPSSLTTQAAAVAGVENLSYGVTGSAVVQGLGVGVLVSLLFALGPLLEMRAIKPLALIRWNLIAAGARDWVRGAVIGVLAAGLVALASWQAASWEAGLWVCGGFAAVAVVLHGVGQALIRLIQPLGAGARFAVRHAVLNLARPGNQTRVILLAVGLGSFFVIGIHAVQANLLGAFALEIREDSPDMFLIDIQQDQRTGVGELLRERVGEAPGLIPVLRARVTGVTGQRTTLDSARAVRRRGVGREFTVTYRDHLEANERVVEGALWEPGGSGEPEVSVEESIRDRLDLAIGDVPAVPRAGTGHPGDGLERPRRRLGRFPQRRLHVPVQVGGLRSGAPQLHRVPAGAAGHDGARPSAAGSGGRVPQRLGHRRARGDRHRPADPRLRHARDLGGRRHRAVQRGSHSHRLGRDDQVPASVRDRHLPDSRRNQPQPRADARRRVRHPGHPGRHRGIGRSPRVDLGPEPPPPGHRLGPGAAREPRRRPVDGAGGGERGRGGQPGHAAPKAVEHAPGRVAAATACPVQQMSEGGRWPLPPQPSRASAPGKHLVLLSVAVRAGWVRDRMRFDAGGDHDGRI